MDAQSHRHFHLRSSVFMQGIFLADGHTSILLIPDVWVVLHWNIPQRGAAAPRSQELQDPDYDIGSNKYFELLWHLLPENLDRLCKKRLALLAAPPWAGRDIFASGVGKMRWSKQECYAPVMEGVNHPAQRGAQDCDNLAVESWFIWISLLSTVLLLIEEETAFK